MQARLRKGLRHLSHRQLSKTADSGCHHRCNKRKLNLSQSRQMQRHLCALPNKLTANEDCVLIASLATTASIVQIASVWIWGRGMGAELCSQRGDGARLLPDICTASLALPMDRPALRPSSALACLHRILLTSLWATTRTMPGTIIRMAGALCQLVHAASAPSFGFGRIQGFGAKPGAHASHPFFPRISTPFSS